MRTQEEVLSCATAIVCRCRCLAAKQGHETTRRIDVHHSHEATRARAPRARRKKRR